MRSALIVLGLAVLAVGASAATPAETNELKVVVTGLN